MYVKGEYLYNRINLQMGRNMTEIVSLIIPSIASVAVVLEWLYFFITPNPPHAATHPKAEKIITLALLSIIFFVLSLTTTIIFPATTIEVYLFILGWFSLLGSILTDFWNLPFA